MTFTTQTYRVCMLDLPQTAWKYALNDHLVVLPPQERSEHIRHWFTLMRGRPGMKPMKPEVISDIITAYVNKTPKFPNFPIEKQNDEMGEFFGFDAAIYALKPLSQNLQFASKVYTGTKIKPGQIVDGEICAATEPNQAMHGNGNGVTEGVNTSRKGKD